jgi:signal peptidase II
VSPRVDGWRRSLALCGMVVLLDQVTKAIVDSALAPAERVNLVLGFQLTDVRNHGVAFGLLGEGGTAVLVITVAALVLIVGYFAFDPTRGGLWVPVGLLTGGALGNLADRVRADAVVDFIDPPMWPAFNVADVAIVAGIVALLWIHGPALAGGAEPSGATPER